MPEIMAAVPPFAQIAAAIRSDITTGRLKPGDEVPSVRQIVEAWSVSRATASRALVALRGEGIVESMPGRGTFVIQRSSTAVRTRYLPGRGGLGKSYNQGESSEILSAGVRDISGEAARAMGAPRGLVRERLIRDEDGPLEYTVAVFPAAFAQEVPELLGADRLPNGMLRAVESATQRAPEACVASVRAEVAGEAGAYLGVSADSPALVVVRKFVSDGDGDGNVLIWVRAVYRPGCTWEETMDLN